MSFAPELQRLSRDFGWSPPPQSIAYDSETWGETAIQTRVTSAYDDTTWNKIEELAAASWWYSTRNEILSESAASILQGTALWDIGGGSGIVARHLISKGVEVILVEPSFGATLLARSHGITSLHGTLDSLGLPESCIPAIGIFDVLQLVENRSKMLSTIHRTLFPGGHLLITVPAIKLLWSQFDLEAKHCLRYSKRLIQAELEKHDFEVVQLGYFFVLPIVPLFALRAIPYRLGVKRLLAEDGSLGSSGGRLGRFAARAETWSAMRTPLGTSIFAIARKT